MTQLDDLQTLTALVRERQLGQLRDIQVEEDALRREISGLMTLRQEAFRADGDAAARRRLGADHAWDDWLGRRLTELNSELARVLARKAPCRDAARAAMARDETVGDLRRREAAEDRALRQLRAERALQTLYLQNLPETGRVRRPGG